MPSTPLSSNWQQFLRVDDIKMESVHLLLQQINNLQADDKEIIATDNQGVLCVPAREDLSQLLPCTHEEADTHLIVHCVDAANKGHKSIMIRTVDTDVIVLAIASFHKLWIAFGTGKSFR